MSKTWKKLISSLLTLSMIASPFAAGGVTVKAESQSEVQSETQEETTKVNYAIGAAASVNDQETDYWGADKAVDGIVNRDAAVKRDQSRWATNRGTDAKILTVDLGAERTFDEFKIEWERTNIQSFYIQVSADGETYETVYDKADSANVALSTTVELDAPVSGQYVKLVVDGYDGGDSNWASVSVYEFKILADVALDNLAIGAAATANASETANFTPEKANDGNAETRWASNASLGEKWLALDFGEMKTVSSVYLSWERCNATSYEIQYDNNGEWVTAVAFTEAPDDFREVIYLYDEIETSKLRLYINEFVAEAPTEGGASVNWPTVSVFEFEAYSLPIDFENVLATIDEVIAALVVPAVEAGADTWTLPEVPEGFAVEFIGADYEQIIDKDLTIYQPLVDTTVSVNYRISKGEDYADTDAYEVVVPGTYEAEEGDNAKPLVIPELAEWKGHTGEFATTDTTKLVVNPEYQDALAYTAESFAADYEDLTGNAIAVEYSTAPAAGDFYFTLGSADAGLKEEGYLMTIADYVTVEAVEKTGAFWAVQSIMQILKQTDGTMPKGITRDYPKFEVRGFMLDVGRKPFEMEYLYETVKTMAYYKMNDFGVHLNDNYIWVENYNDTETDQWGAYSAFRLESDVKAGGNDGKNQADLTASDLYYTKDEFRQFIKDAREMGVDVVPEFDTPAHSLAFTKVRPDLAMPEDSVTRWADHLYLENPEAEEFVKSVWDEYLTGDDPVFDQDTIINIGTDEYEGDNDTFRQYTANMIEYVQNSGRTVRHWGSISRKTGTVEVPSEDVQMYVWNTGWANPQNMYTQGFDLINIQDSYVYMVPSGRENRGGYGDRLNLQYLYDSWTPNAFGSAVIPAGSEHMLGGSFAIWNDNIDLRANGLSEYDNFDRFFEAAPYIAAKAWGDGEDQSYEEFAASTAIIGLAPNTNPYSEVETDGNYVAEYNFDDESVADTSGNQYDGAEGENTAYVEGKEGNALQLNGGSSYVTTPIEAIGPETRVSFWVKADADATGEQILFDDGHTQIKMSQIETGKVGFTREFYDYSFDYELPKDEWVYLTFKTAVKSTELYVNGTLVDTVSSSGTGGKHATLVFPLAKIGSEENAFTGLIDELKVINVVDTELNAYLDEQIAAVSAEEYYYDAKMEIISQLAVWNSDLEESTADELPTMEELQAKVAALLESYEDCRPLKNEENLVSSGKETSGGNVENASSWPTSNIVDGNVSSTCSTIMGDPENPAYVQVDLGESMVLQEIQVVCYFRDGRWNKYDVYTSEDGETFTLLENKDDSIGETSAGNWFDASGVSARYIRLVGVANSVNVYFHVGEVKVYVKDADYSAVEAALASVPADLSNYTEESVAALNEAINAVVYDLKASEQDAVDAMAQAIVDAVAGLKEIVFEIVTQPTDDAAIKGQTVSTTVVATGKDLTYTWYYKNPGNWKFYKSGDAFVSEDGATYSIPMYAFRDGQQVYCEITDASGATLRTNTVTLTMDNGGIVIVKQPESVAVPVGEAAEVTVEATGEGLTYTWYYKNPGNVKFYESGAQFVSEDGVVYSITMANWRDGQQVYCVITNATGAVVQTNTVTLSVAK